jgi:hypothetical protein
VATNNFSPADRIDEIIDSQIANKSMDTQSEESPEREESSDAEKAAAEYLRFRQLSN